MDDNSIIKLFFKRSEDALIELSDKYGRVLQKLLTNKGLSKEDAEECVNDTMYAVWSKIPPENPDYLPAFIFKIANNLGAKKYAYEHRQKRDATLKAADELLDDLPCRSAEDEVMATELGRKINLFIDRLDSEMAAIFVQRFWLGESVKDIASRKGVTANTISLQLYRTKKELKEFLIKEGYN